MSRDSVQPGIIVSGPFLPESMEVLAVVPMGESLKIIGKGLQTGLARDPVLTPDQISRLTISSERLPFDGDARLFRLGVEAHRLGLAYEYDPYFSLSIARVDPLPHQLEAVYDYFLKLPRIRFLLADDPGAGKTIMAGLLLKEMKARGLVRRTLVVSPANLTFQWQRELKDKFREKFEVIRSDVLRANYGVTPWQNGERLYNAWITIGPDHYRAPTYARGGDPVEKDSRRLNRHLMPDDYFGLLRHSRAANCYVQRREDCRYLCFEYKNVTPATASLLAKILSRIGYRRIRRDAVIWADYDTGLLAKVVLTFIPRREVVGRPTEIVHLFSSYNEPVSIVPPPFILVQKRESHQKRRL